jgi:hypothetical protein
VPSTMASGTDLNAREYAVALPYGAVLAARTLGPSIWAALPKRALAAYGARSARLARWTAPALAGVLCCYLASLGYTAAQPSAPAANRQLATWLAAHNLTYGIGGYWQSSIVTLDSEGQVTIRAVYPGNLRRDWWHPCRDVPGHRGHARLLQLLAAEFHGSGDLRPAGRHLRGRALHGLRVAEELARRMKYPDRHPRVMLSVRPAAT